MATPAEGDPAPRPSATVVLARAAAQAPELLLVHRRAGATFGASYVFPGGVLDTADGQAPEFSGELSAAAADQCLGLRCGALDYYCAAIRELFEETGVLLAHQADDRAGAPPREALAEARTLLNDGRLCWSDFLRANSLVLDCDALHYFAWWVTPHGRPQRFSTRFFLAAMPAGQDASHDGRELTDSRWTTAMDALRASARRELELPPPTLATLRDLAAFGDLESLLGWGRARARAGVPRVLPVIRAVGGRERILMPGDPDYPLDAGREAT